MKNIKHLFKNEIMKKVLLFFNENPNSIDTAKGISIWVGCDADKVQGALDKLVEENILVNHKSSSTNAYSYTNKKDIVKKIEKYTKRLH
ncbi:hypothetical protein ACFL0P_02180 [Candidatus Omnitrophota bacterium]